MATSTKPQPDLEPSNQKRVYDDPGYNPNLTHDPLEDAYNAPSATTSGSDIAARNREIKDLEDAYGSQSADTKNRPLSGGTDIGQREVNPRDTTYGTSALDDMRDRVGRGYTDEEDSDTGTSRRRRNNSRFKKRAAIVSTAVGTGAAASVIAFMLMIPLKVNGFVEMIQGKAAASTTQALEKMAGKLLSEYMRDSVTHALNTSNCKSTIDPSCVVTVKGDGPVAKVKKAWSQNRLQEKLAKNQGIVIGLNARTNTYYMSIGDHVSDPAEFRKFMNGELSLTDMDLKGMSRSEVRRKVMSAFENETTFKRAYHRYIYGRLLESRWRIKRCVIACDIKDKFTDKKEAKLLAGKLFIAHKVGGVLGESYGLVFDCVMQPDVCDSKLNVTTEEHDEPTTRMQRELNERLNAYIAAHGVEKLAKLYENAADINKLGFGGFITKEAFGKVAEKLGGTAAKDATKEATAKAIPIIGWVSLALSISEFAEKAPVAMQYLAYSTHVAEGATLFAIYQSTASEQKSGHMDSTELGSVADTLSAEQDMTTHPIYSAYEPTTTASSGNGIAQLIANVLTPQAYAASDGIFKCDDGKPVPAGTHHCKEEEPGNAGIFSLSSDARRNIQVAQVALHSSFPLLTIGYQFNHIYNIIPNFLGGIISTVVGKAATATCSIIPGCNSLMDDMKKKATEYLTSFIDKIIANPYTNLSGGRILALSSMGATAAYEKAQMLKMGGAPISDTTYLQTQNDELADEKADFEGRSIFGRVFATDTSYSLVSRLALATNGPSYITNSTLGTLLANPFSRLSSAVSTAFPGKSVFAATTSVNNEFGIVHYGNTTLPDHVQQYWDDHCEGRDFKKDFFSSMSQNPNTGEATSTKEEPCMLIESTLISTGARYDSSFIPADTDGDASGNSDQSSDIGGVTSGSTIDLAKQILNSPNISFQTPEKRAYFESVATTGRQDSCGGNTIDSRLLGTILSLSQKYKLVLGVFIDGHSCNNGFHPKGKAVDINGVNPLGSSTLKGTGNRIEWSDDEQPILRQFYIDAAALLSEGGGGGLGQEECIAGDPPPMPAGVSLFADTCNHVHMDVGIR